MWSDVHETELTLSPDGQVTLVGLVLRIRPDELAKDPFSEGIGFTQVCSTYNSYVRCTPRASRLLARAALGGPPYKF